MKLLILCLSILISGTASADNFNEYTLTLELTDVKPTPACFELWSKYQPDKKKTLPIGERVMDLVMDLKISVGGTFFERVSSDVIQVDVQKGVPRSTYQYIFSVLPNYRIEQLRLGMYDKDMIGWMTDDKLTEDIYLNYSRPGSRQTFSTQCFEGEVVLNDRIAIDELTGEEREVLIDEGSLFKILKPVPLTE